MDDVFSKLLAVAKEFLVGGLGCWCGCYGDGTVLRIALLQPTSCRTPKYVRAWRQYGRA